MLHEISLKTVIACIGILFLYQAFSRTYSVQFSKKIENNLCKSFLENVQPDGSIKYPSNLDSKTDYELLFFDEFNAHVEYYFERDWKSPWGFRIIRDSTNKHYLLEVKNIPNFQMVDSVLMEEYPMVTMSLEDFGALTDSMMRVMGAHSTEMDAKRHKESLKHYRVETKTLRISDQLAEALHDKFMHQIDRFDSKMEGPATGYRVTFRCVVENEVWTVAINDEFPSDALALSDLCRQIIADVRKDCLDETKYIKLLK